MLCVFSIVSLSRLPCNIIYSNSGVQSWKNLKTWTWNATSIRSHNQSWLKPPGFWCILGAGRTRRSCISHWYEAWREFSAISAHSLTERLLKAQSRRWEDKLTHHKGKKPTFLSDDWLKYRFMIISLWDLIIPLINLIKTIHTLAAEWHSDFAIKPTTTPSAKNPFTITKKSSK